MLLVLTRLLFVCQDIQFGNLIKRQFSRIFFVILYPWLILVVISTKNTYCSNITLSSLYFPLSFSLTNESVCFKEHSALRNILSSRKRLWLCFTGKKGTTQVCKEKEINVRWYEGWLTSCPPKFFFSERQSSRVTTNLREKGVKVLKNKHFLAVVCILNT